MKQLKFVAKNLSTLVVHSIYWSTLSFGKLIVDLEKVLRSYVPSDHLDLLHRILQVKGSLTFISDKPFHQLLFCDISISFKGFSIYFCFIFRTNEKLRMTSYSDCSVLCTHCTQICDQFGQE